MCLRFFYGLGCWCLRRLRAGDGNSWAALPPSPCARRRGAQGKPEILARLFYFYFVPLVTSFYFFTTTLAFVKHTVLETNIFAPSLPHLPFLRQRNLLGGAKLRRGGAGGRTLFFSYFIFYVHCFFIFTSGVKRIVRLGHTPHGTNRNHIGVHHGNGNRKKGGKSYCLGFSSFFGLGRLVVRLSAFLCIGWLAGVFVFAGNRGGENWVVVVRGGGDDAGAGRCGFWGE